MQYPTLDLNLISTSTQDLAELRRNQFIPTYIHYQLDLSLEYGSAEGYSRRS